MVTKDYKGEVFKKISKKDGVEWKNKRSKQLKRKGCNSKESQYKRNWGQMH